MQVQKMERVEAQEPMTALALGGAQVGGRPSGYSAELVSGEFRALLSQLDGEEGWTVDGEFKGGRPIFYNGFGARYLITRKALPEAAALLDSARDAAAVGASA